MGNKYKSDAVQIQQLIILLVVTDFTGWNTMASVAQEQRLWDVLAQNWSRPEKTLFSDYWNSSDKKRKAQLWS